jgi:hypothetical protein
MAEGYPDWFKRTGAETFFARNLLPLAGQKLDFLQIGAYTGDATEWLFEHILTNPESTLTDVDPWTGSDEPAHYTLDWKSVEDTYLERHKDKIESGRLKVFKGTSDEFFSSDEGKRGFHFIYIDGNHEAAQVLKDGLNAIYRTGIGGIVAFDDYMWTLGKGLWADPKPAVDAIYYCHSNKLEVIDKGVQVWLKRTSL